MNSVNINCMSGKLIPMINRFSIVYLEQALKRKTLVVVCTIGEKKNFITLKFVEMAMI